MKVPDLFSAKVLYPALVFIFVKLFVRTDDISEALTFGILYYLALKFGTRPKQNITKQDILMPSVTMFLLFPSSSGDGSIAYHAALFMLTHALLRGVFPS